MKSKSVRIVAVVLGTIFFAQLSEAKLNIVATTPDLGAIAQEVGGDRIVVTALAKPTEDPHFVTPKPSFIVKLNGAQALIEGGLELELGWLPSLVDQTRNARIQRGAPGRIVASEVIQPLEVPTVAVTRDMGDIHALGNPHFLTDPVNGKLVAQHLCEAFCRLDADGCATYQANLAQFAARLDAKLAEWQKLFAPHRGARLVAYHNTWPYFARRFGLKIDLFLEPKPGIPPTPANLASVIATMKAGNIRAILVEPCQNRRTAEKVAADTGAVVLDVAQYPGGVKGGEDGYIELIDHLVRTVSAALEGGERK